MSLLIHGATIIDGLSDAPIENQSLLIEGQRVRAIGRRDDLRPPVGTRVIDAQGRYIIPGLMNANVHLFAAFNVDTIFRYLDQFEDLIAESAEVALKNGMTTVFDTWGPRRHLMNVRDRINEGRIPGSRIFCAGNIVGFDGPFSADFLVKAAEVVNPVVARRINAVWVENVGRHLMWLTPDEVAREVSTYIEKGIDFVKYAANDHFPGPFLAFSPRVQAAIAQAAHRAGVTVQAHSMSVEGLRCAIEAGCNLVTHCNITGPITIPEDTLELFGKHRTGAVVFAWKQRGLDWVMKNVSEVERTWWRASDTNARNLIRSDALILMANDGAIYPAEMKSDPAWSQWSVSAPNEFNLFSLEQGHFLWLEAMEEKGCPPMKMLQAATRNIALAYGKDKDLGSIAPGKIADLLILEKNPLAAAANYRTIQTVIKEGQLVDRDALPLKPLLTRPLEAPPPEEASFVPFVSSGSSFPLCPTCSRH